MSTIKNIEIEVVNTTKQIADLVDWLIFRHEPPEPMHPTMYIDLEGVNLCRNGSLSIFTLLVDTGVPVKMVHIIDIYTLGKQAFETTSIKGKTLKDILEDEKVPKIFFDVRNDSDALFAHYGVALKGVEDVQLIESATRKTAASRRLLNGLATCVENDVSDGRNELARWKQAKKKGERLFKPEQGGSWDVFNERPIPNDIIAYCVGDVQYLPELRKKFLKPRADRWQDLVREESNHRVKESQKANYQPHGPDRALAPWSEEQNKSLDDWNYVAPPYYDFDHSDDLFDRNDDSYDDDWFDDGPTSVRDILNDEDIAYYYSD